MSGARNRERFPFFIARGSGGEHRLVDPPRLEQECLEIRRDDLRERTPVAFNGEKRQVIEPIQES